MKTMTVKLAAALAVAATLAAPFMAQARSGGVVGAVAASPPGSGHGNWQRGGDGGWGHHGGWRHHGYWGPDPFWGGWGLGIGFGAFAYSAPYYGGYYGGYYPYPGYVVGPGVAEYVVVDPAPGDRFVRRGNRFRPPHARPIRSSTRRTGRRRPRRRPTHKSAIVGRRRKPAP